MEQFDITLVINYLEISIVIACFIIGFIIKRYIPQIDNRYIPLVMTILGVVGNCIYAYTSNNPIDFNTIVQGAFSGLSSTGLHQLISKSTGLKKSTTDTSTTENVE